MIRQRAARLLNYEVWLLTLLAIPCVLFERWYFIPLGVAAAFWLMRYWSTGLCAPTAPFHWGVVGLVIMLAVSVAVSIHPERSFAAALQVLIGMALFYALFQWIDREGRLVLAELGLLVGGLGLAAVALAGSSRVMSILGLPAYAVAHQNVVSGAVVLLAPLPVGALLFHWKELRWWQRTGLVLAFFWMAGAVAVTLSRGAYLGLAAGMAVLLILRWPKAGTLAVLASGLALWLWGQDLLQWMAYRLDTGGGNWAGRVEIWRRAVIMIYDFPLTGIGMGNFPDAIELLYLLSATPGNPMPHAHQLLLQIAVDVGLPGLLAWLAIWLPLVYISIRTFIRIKDLRGRIAGLLASQMVLLAHGSLDAVTWGTRPAVILWVVWGVLAAAALRLPSANPKDVAQ